MAAKIKSFLTSKTTLKLGWSVILGSGIFIGCCVVFEWNDAAMKDIHEWLSFAWKAIPGLTIPKAYLDSKEISK